MTHFVPEIIPALLVKSPEEVLQKWPEVMEAAHVQIDCLDGQFVPNVSFFSAQSWPTRGPGVELHLMCQHPLVIMQEWEHHPLLRRVIWHAEIGVNHAELIAWCRQRHLDCGMALNPETPLDHIAAFAKDLDTLVLLSVHPGWSGQPFLPTTLAKLSEARTRFPDLPIGIDGGVTEALIPELCQRGANHFYLGSQIFAPERTSPRQALHHLTQVSHHLSV